MPADATSDETLDCVVVGGGAAGLSAALVLGRARRETVVVDSGKQSNLAAAHIGGLLGSDQRAPGDFYASAREELGAYPAVEVRNGEVATASADGDGFAVELADGSRLSARRLLIAAGMDYRPPDLPGVAERWGGSVFHCPFCHGWEMSGTPLAVLQGGDAGVTRALMLRAWSDDVTLLTGGEAGPDEDQREQLAASGIAVDERTLAEVRGPDKTVEAVVFEDGEELAVNGLMVHATLHQRSDLAARLGIDYAEETPLSAEALQADGMLETSVSGVYAAGDVLAQMPSVANSVASGAKAGAMIVMGLTT
jgi:thioredoxin reductase